MTDGYELHMLDMGLSVLPLRHGCVIEVRKFECKKDFFDIKEGMIIWGYDNPELDDYKKYGCMTMVIDAKKFKDQPLNTDIFYEHFEEYLGLPDFYMIEKLPKKEFNRILNSHNNKIYYE